MIDIGMKFWVFAIHRKERLDSEKMKKAKRKGMPYCTPIPVNRDDYEYYVFTNEEITEEESTVLFMWAEDYWKEEQGWYEEKDTMKKMKKINMQNESENLFFDICLEVLKNE